MTMANEINITLSREDLAAIRSALNEILEILDEWDFEIRMGRSRDEIKSLLHRLKMIAESDQ